MAKRNVSARIPEEMFEQLEQMAAETGKEKTDLITEAIAQYLGVAVESSRDRLLTLERGMEEMQGKLRLLSNG